MASAASCYLPVGVGGVKGLEVLHDEVLELIHRAGLVAKHIEQKGQAVSKTTRSNVAKHIQQKGQAVSKNTRLNVAKHIQQKGQAVSKNTCSNVAKHIQQQRQA